MTQRSTRSIQEQALARCQRAFPAWRGLDVADFDFADPKGFSSFTMGIRARVDVTPPAVLYRQLEGKENAILDFEAERRVFLALSEAGVGPTCHAYDREHRLEGFYEGRTLTRHDLKDPTILRGIGRQLHRLHQVDVEALPGGTFFERLHAKWGPLARRVLEEERQVFPDHEQRLCDDLAALVEDDTLDRVLRLLPEGPVGFCHNDTYHGNTMLLASGEVRLLDFEFSCLNHRAFDFANLFAETVMRHGLAAYPHFAIAEPEFGEAEVGVVVDAYVEAEAGLSRAARNDLRARLVRETLELVPLSDYMYAMAALPLAVAPIQKIRFLPYAHQRFRRFMAAWEARFG